MCDKLKYRLPGKGEIVKKGRFFKLENVSSYQGFLVSNFDQSQYYGFEEGGFDLIENPQREPYCISKDEYLLSGKKLVENLNSSDLDKVILSRVLKQECNSSPSAIYSKLVHEYPSAFVYQIESARGGNGWGATPESLVQSNLDTISTVSLAGTKSANDE